MKRRKLNNKYLLLLLILFIGIGFAYVTYEFTIAVSGTLHAPISNIYFANASAVNGSVNDGSSPWAPPANPTINTAGDTVSFSPTFTNLGDYYEFTVDVKNDGYTDAMVESLAIKTLVNDVETDISDFATITVKYSDGTTVAPNQLLWSRGSIKYRIRVEYREDGDASSFKTSGSTSVTIQVTPKYIKATNAAIPVKYVCKRATTLHTEECENTENGCKSDGYTASGSKGTTTITYGNLGTTGTLAYGDAFDCDVNDDGVFNTSTERFYYISTDDNDNVSMIYYNNVGTSNYCDSSDSKLGPTALLSTLPSKSSWKNDGLNVEVIRKLKDNGGYTLSSNKFTYTGAAARLIDAVELRNNCKTGNAYYGVGNSNYTLSKCNYLLENTVYANPSSDRYYWTEAASDTTRVVLVDGQSVSYMNTDVTNSYPVRPVIDMKKNRVQY